MERFLKLIMMVALLAFAFYLNAEEKNYSSFGTRADNVVIDAGTIAEPPLSHTKKAFVTENKFGFDTINSDLNWVTETFLKSIRSGMVVMDVGAGYGTLSRLALNKGAIVINNEISQKQQQYSLKFVKKCQKKRLYLHHQDIRKTSFSNEVFDAIIFHRILHFFKGKEIENILIKSYQWLKPGGKIYIVMMSKDHIAFRNKINYDTSKKWPGEDLVVVKKHLPDQAYALPKTLHVASIETLEKVLKRIGFEIEHANFVSMKKFGVESNRDGKEAIGIIAAKIK